MAEPGASNAALQAADPGKSQGGDAEQQQGATTEDALSTSQVCVSSMFKHVNNCPSHG